MGVFTNLSLFSGVGGLDIAGKSSGQIRTVCYIENDPYAQAVLMSRMQDGSLDNAPIWDDVRSFDAPHWRGLLDIVSGGFPCQDLSVAGKQRGITGERSGLWKEFARIIREVGPKYVLVENVPGLIYTGGIATVLGEMAEMGFDAEWFCNTAAEAGAPHKRERCWIIAYSRCIRVARQGKTTSISEIIRERARKSRKEMGWQNYTGDMLGWIEKELIKPSYGGGGEPLFIRVEDGPPSYVDRLRCCGNGVVAQQAMQAWNKIIEMSEM